MGNIGAWARGHVSTPEPLGASLSHGILALGRYLALRDAWFDRFYRCPHACHGHFGRRSDAFDLIGILDHAQFGHDVGAVFDCYPLWLGVGMGEHAHHGSSEEGELQP